MADETKKIPYILNGGIFKIKKRKGDRVIVECVCCPSQHRLRGNLANGAGNFHQHIKRRHPFLIDNVTKMKKDKKEKVAAAKIAKRRRKLSFDDDKSQESDKASITELEDGLRLMQEGNEKNLLRQGIQILLQQIRKNFLLQQIVS
ncbi:protein stand still-like [Drosophila innubila]|uniref:protein stand still-like n=1 Tax=Drosophila innubila TaxID=198719 RepID=UPI00148D5678|nr:protein stand still-like [Drosophila innubila]